MPRGRSAMIIERAPLPIVEVQGSAHRVSHVNSAFCRLLGKSREDLIGKAFSDIVPGGDQCMPVLDRVYQTGESATLVDDSDPDSTVWLYAMWPALDADEQPEGVIIQLAKTTDLRQEATAVKEALLLAGLRQHELMGASEKLNAQLTAEIAERQQADKALSESEDRYRALYAALPVAAFVCDRDAVIQNYNRRAVELWGREPAVGVERHCGSMRLILPDGSVLPHAQSPMMEVMSTGTPCRNVEVSIERPDGSRIPVIINFCALKDAQGKIVGAVTSFDDISARKQAEQAILCSEENYRLLVEGATGFAIIRLQLDGTVSSWNVGAERIFGYGDAEILGAHFSSFFTPEDQAVGKPAGELRGASALEKADDDNWLVRKDGSRFWASGATTALRDEAGNLRGYAKIVRDVTIHRAANEQLRATEARKSAILDCALDAIITMDHEGKVVDFNPAAERIFGRRREEMSGQRMAEKIIPARLREQHYQGLAAYLASGEGPVLEKRIEVPALHADGHEFMIELSINRITGVEPAMFTATLRDITERQRAEGALRESELRFRALADNIPQLAWMTDATGAIFWYNQRWFDFTGTTLAEMKGWGWQAVHHPDHLPRIMKRWPESLAAGTDFDDTFPLRGADGKYRWFLTRAVPIRDESGNVQRWFGTNTDVTEQRDAADALALAKEQVEAASRAKDDFLAALSHELRTPLTPVLMTATALESDPALSPEVHEQLAMMRRNIELEARLIDDLLDLTRISRGKLSIAPVVADIHELIGHTAEIVRSDELGKQVRIVFILEAARHHTLGDPARLQQVFWNLIKNALKFTPSGGTITVSTKNVERGGIAVTCEDTGIGISAETMPHIFRAFEQGDVAGQHRYGGLGLGLAISRAIVGVHGGTISAQSEGTGLGSKFTVTLATVDAPAPAANASSPNATPARALRLLIVEDHEATRTVLTRLLTRSGHRITAVTTMREALAAFAAERFDAVVSDLGLPDGSGLDLMREIQRQRAVPAIALSGYGMEDDLRQTKEAGFCAHLVKPVNVDQLRDLLDRIMVPVE